MGFRDEWQKIKDEDEQKRRAKAEAKQGKLGTITRMKVDNVTEPAERALWEGRRYFVCQLNAGIRDNFSGPLTHVAEMIEAIEDVGWELKHTAYMEGRDRDGSIVATFRRAA